MSLPGRVRRHQAAATTVGFVQRRNRRQRVTPSARGYRRAPRRKEPIRRTMIPAPVRGLEGLRSAAAVEAQRHGDVRGCGSRRLCTLPGPLPLPRPRRGRRPANRRPRSRLAFDKVEQYRRCRCNPRAAGHASASAAARGTAMASPMSWATDTGPSPVISCSGQAPWVCGVGAWRRCTC